MPEANRDLERLPRILVKGVPKAFGSFDELGKAFAKSDPLLAIAGRFGAVADKLFMDTNLCLINLSGKVGECVLAHERSGSFIGRLINKLTGWNAQFVEVSGAVLAGVMHYLDQKVPEQLDRGRDYLLRRDYAQDLLAEMKIKAKAEGRIE